MQEGMCARSKMGANVIDFVITKPSFLVGGRDCPGLAKGCWRWFKSNQRIGYFSIRAYFLMDSALLKQIQSGKKLKKAVTNDRSAPVIDGKSTGGSASAASSGLARPPIGGGAGGGAGGPPGLGGLFAGGVPQLRKTSGPGSRPEMPTVKPPTIPKASTVSKATGPTPPQLPGRNTLPRSFPAPAPPSSSPSSTTIARPPGRAVPPPPPAPSPVAKPPSRTVPAPPVGRKPPPLPPGNKPSTTSGGEDTPPPPPPPPPFPASGLNVSSTARASSPSRPLPSSAPTRGMPSLPPPPPPPPPASSARVSSPPPPPPPPPPPASTPSSLGGGHHRPMSSLPPPPPPSMNGADARARPISLQPPSASVSRATPSEPTTEGRWTFRPSTEFPAPRRFEKRTKVYPSGARSGSSIAVRF
ncbi:uncharacterized protein VTP21DRAFT_6933 [Calcarisporiella thermophila]|uniref:uncharacterized protein n=1 Tax=Calcarisporiella thermophila TaxID=911321 RepID=UPI0037433E4A